MIHPRNYTPAARPEDHPVTLVVLHSTEETHADTLRIFADPARQVSAHYLVRSRDGHVTRLLDERHIAWHSGNRHTNQHSIGIEHEGWAADGPTWFTPALYRSTATLIRDLARRHRIPLDRQHILGHDNVPAPTPDRIPTMHDDPGPHWDWARLLDLLGRPVQPGRPGSPLLTVRRNTPVRAAPHPTAPALGRAAAGQQYAAAERRTGAEQRPGLPPRDGSRAPRGRDAHDPAAWNPVWYDGRRGWLPADAAVPGSGLLARPRHTIDVHGSPLEADPLPRTITPGQAYACGGPVPAPGRWLSIQLGQRLGYVPAADVRLLPVGAENSPGLLPDVS